MPPTNEELRRQAEAQRKATEELEEHTRLRREARSMFVRLLSSGLPLAERLILKGALEGLSKLESKWGDR